MPLSQAQSIANAQGLSLYAKVELLDETHYINRDNIPFANFDVSGSALASSGAP
jgi:hypothetical protein